MSQVIWNSDIDVYNSDVIPISVARGIAKYLQISDLLVFSSVSKNTFKTVNDPQLWILMLKQIGIWGMEHTKGKEKNFKNIELGPLNCLDFKVLEEGEAKHVMLKIYKCLDKYYSDILSNKSFDKLRHFQDFRSPEEQCKILKNLLEYSKIDKNDETRYVAQEKLSSLFEIFENALLRELDIHFDLEDFTTMRRFVSILIELDNQQTLIDFFIQKSVFDNTDSTFDVLEALNIQRFFIEVEQKDLEDVAQSFLINQPEFESLMRQLVKIFNYESKIIDLIFPVHVPMMYKVSEELILNQLSDRFGSLIEESKLKRIYLYVVPYLYNLIRVKLIPGLSSSDNLGEGYHHLIQELFDMQFEQIVSEYTREEIVSFKSKSNQKIAEWKGSTEKREEETTQSILKNVKAETKNDFLTSFRKVFTVGTSVTASDTEVSDKETYSEVQAKEKILTENMKSINKTFSLKLAVEIINEGKKSIVRVLNFENFSIISSKNIVMSTVQEVFISVLELIGQDHLTPGFEKALSYLRTYKPSDVMKEVVEPIKPLVLFSDLVNIADVIIQMVEIFYKEELINRNIIKNENSILNPSLQRKKKFEEMVDTYVADGLNIGIDVLIQEIQNTYDIVLQDQSYCPQTLDTSDIGLPTNAARKVIQILDGNFDLLVGCTEKSIVDVFQQELAERFFQVIVKTIKKSTISNTGAVTLIADLNLYYECIFDHIKTNKRLILPLFQSLKKLGSIYLISGEDSKAIGKLVSDLSKFNGIFGQEEIYEFVQRREDWPTVKRHVEKIMYGLSMGDCCII